MKKRLLPLLLVVALLVTAAVFSVSAAEGDKCPCGCGAAADSVTWEPWSADVNVAAGGHYRMYEDMVATKVMNYGTGANSNSFALDLNGHVWRGAEGMHLITIGTTANTCEVTILDTSATGTGEMQATGTAGDAAVVKVAYGGKLILRGGTIRQLYTANATTLGVVYVDATNGASKFDMYDGTITDGYTTSTAQTSAGNVLLRGANSVMNMYGGKIVNGYAVTNGGGVTTYGTFTMSGGTIANNACVGTGSNQGLGGNIMVNGGAAPVFKDDAEVKNGVSFGRGANIYNKIANAKFENVSKIDGDIYTIANVKLAGEVYIPMGNSNGLLLKSGAKVSFENFVGYDEETGEGSIVYFGVELTASNSADFTSGGSAYLKSFRNVGRTTGVAVNGSNLKASRAGNAEEQTSYCPHCGEDAEPVAWYRTNNMYAEELDENQKATGFYVFKNTVLNTDGTQKYTHFFHNSSFGAGIKFSGEFVLDLCGQALTSSQQGFVITGTNSELAIMDTVGGGTYTGKGIKTESTTAHGGNGGVINVEATSAKATVSIYSGKVQLNASSSNYITRGGVIGMNGGDLNIYGGIISGGKTTHSSKGKTGGNIYMNNGAFTMTGGVITGGKAGGNGGNINVNSAATVNITGGMILDGTVTSGQGGNLYLASNGATISNALIRGGSATTYGGSISINVKKAFTLNNVTVVGGSGANGGNISVEQATQCDIKNAVIYNGTATAEGGNVFFRANAASNLLQNTHVFNGKAHSAVAEEQNDRSDNVYVGKKTTLDGVHVSGNSGLNEMGAGVTVAAAEVTLKNGTVIGSVAAPRANTLYLKNTDGGDASLVVDESFSGAVVLSANWLLEEGYRQNPYGQFLLRSEAGAFSGKLYMGDHKTTELVDEESGEVTRPSEVYELGMPGINHVDGSLRVDGATVHNGDTFKTYFDAATAMANHEFVEGDMLKLWIDGEVFTMNAGSYIIDMNGKSANITANGDVTITGIDSYNLNPATGNFRPAGMLSVDDGNVIVKKSATLGGDQYVTVANGDVYDFHYITMDITKVTLRASGAGIFYKGKWNCDADLATYIQENKLDYGVVVSLSNMPGANFATEAWDANSQEENVDKYPNLYSAYGGETFKKGVEQNGVLINNIMRIVENPANNRTPEQNTTYCEMPIYATAYLSLGENEYIVGDNGASLNLMDVLKRIDLALVEDPNYTTGNNTAAAVLMDSFYATWKDSGLSQAIANYKNKEVDPYTFQVIFQETGSEPAAEG